MARVRNRVVDIIAKKDEEFKKNNEALLKLYGKKGKDGKVIISEQDGRTTVQLSNVQKYSDEYKKLLDEDVIIDLLPSNTSDFKAIKVILSKLDVEMDYTDTKILDELLERFNLIK
jgi:dihydrodipicolinate reductase